MRQGKLIKQFRDQGKQIPPSQESPKRVVAGKILHYIATKDSILHPVFYKGSIVKIGSKIAVPLDSALLSYQSKAQLNRAVKDGDLKIVAQSPLASTKV